MRVLSLRLTLAFSLSALPLYGQQPTVEHAQFTASQCDHGLAAQLRELEHDPGPAWVGYAVPVSSEFHTGDNTGRVRFLEGGDHHESYSGESDQAFDHVNILMRLEGGQVEKLDLENPDRKLNAGGLRFTWLTNVTADDSVHVLQSIAQGNSVQKLREEAVFFISLHKSSAATPALSELTTPPNNDSIREKAAFWLANQRGHDGFLVIQKLAHDGDLQLREKITFDLTLTHDPGAVDTLIGMARNDPSPQVRKQAQFWMANVGGKKIVGELRASAEQDPNEENRRSAVFALSRLPEDEATTQLIQIAKTSTDPQVRKQAVFWLGQSSDPKATDFLAQILESSK
jgi:hypothetical protein